MANIITAILRSVGKACCTIHIIPLELLGVTRVPILHPGRGAEPRLRARGEAQPAPQQRPAGAGPCRWLGFLYFKV